MRDFICPNCGQHLAFENSVCLSCSSPLGFSLDDMALLVIASGEDERAAGLRRRRQVRAVRQSASGRMQLAGARRARPRQLCMSCALTRTRPNDADSKALAAFADAEKAKRRLIAELNELKLPIVGRDEDPDYGLAFDLLSSEHEKVFTGHENGVITLDLAEGDDVHREQLRIAMDEPYRTLLGHFRHEIGHYYFYRLVGPSPDYTQRFRELFGDPDADYQAALDRHYSEGAPAGLGGELSSRPTPRCTRPRTGPRPSRTTCTSATPSTPPRLSASRRPPRRSSEECWAPAASTTIIDMWLPLSWALNMVNRSMGKRGPLPVRAAAAGAGQDAVHPYDRRRDHL